jgi:hypothetical protein
MKTLDQIEAKLEKRTPINSLPFTINQPGSYYLTNNLQFTAASGNAITITVSNVTLDLMGFTLSSSNPVTGAGIKIAGGLRNIAVRNGVIAGNTTVAVSGNPRTWTTTPGGFANAIDAVGPEATNGQFSHLRIFGCRGIGLDAGNGAVVEQVTATENGGTGIDAFEGSVTNSTSILNGFSGISAGSVSNSVARDNESNGISATAVANSSAVGNGTDGLNIAAGGTITNSKATSNGGNGIFAPNGTVSACFATSNNKTGIHAANGTVTSSIAIGNGDDGIFASTGVVAFCRASGNNKSNNGSVPIDAAGATRTGNNPTP